jgi:hypothetical protein
MKKLFFGSLLIDWFSFACHSPKKTTDEKLKHQLRFNLVIQKKIICANGAVVSAHPLSKQSGVEILKQEAMLSMQPSPHN